MICGNDFKFRDELKQHDTVPVELLTDPYKGVILKYTKISVQEKPEEDTAIIRFEYELIETGEHSEVGLRRNHHFQKTISNLLNVFLLEGAVKPESEDDEADSRVE